MLSNCDVVEDSWESLGLQGDLTSQSYRKSVLNIHWENWCWSWNSNTLATSCEELTHWKRPWCWKGLGAGGEGDNRGWDGIIDSMDMSLSELRELGMDREAWHAVIHGVTKSWTWLSNWTELNWYLYLLAVPIGTDNLPTLLIFPLVGSFIRLPMSEFIASSAVGYISMASSFYLPF